MAVGVNARSNSTSERVADLGYRTLISVRHMTTINPSRYVHGEVLSGVQRRRRWAPEEKVRIVEETYLPGMSVSLVAGGWG